MKRHLHEVWSEPSFRTPSRKVWKVQGQHGIATFRLKRDAIICAETMSGKKYWEISYAATLGTHMECGVPLQRMR